MTEEEPERAPATTINRTRYQTRATIGDGTRSAIVALSRMARGNRLARWSIILPSFVRKQYEVMAYSHGLVARKRDGGQ